MRRQEHERVLSEPRRLREETADDEEHILVNMTQGGYHAGGMPPAPLRQHLAVSWLSEDRRHFSLNASYRYGATVVNCLQTMAPSTWKHMISVKPGEDTEVFPVVFPWLADAQTSGGGNKAPEVTRSRVAFVHAATILVLELMLGPKTERVLFTTFYTRLLGEFRAWLQASLQDIMQAISWNLGRPYTAEDEAVTVESLESTRRLIFSTTHKAGGVTVHSTILLALRRQTQDVFWEGTVLQHLAYKYIGCTRATQRLYVLAEDLRSGVSRPFAPEKKESTRVDAIIEEHQMDHQLMVNGARSKKSGKDGQNCRRGKYGVREFECQAEWSSFLWWLENWHWRHQVEFRYVQDLRPPPALQCIGVSLQFVCEARHKWPLDVRHRLEPGAAGGRPCIRQIRQRGTET